MWVWEEKLVIIMDILLETWQRKEKRVFTDDRMVKKEILFSLMRSIIMCDRWSLDKIPVFLKALERRFGRIFPTDYSRKKSFASVLLICLIVF